MGETLADLDDDPFALDREETLNDNLLTVMRQLVDKQDELEREIKDLETTLENKQAVHRGMLEIEIPTALGGLQGKFDLKDGRFLEVGQKIRASIAGEKKEPAVRWLDDHDYGNLVKREIKVQFNKDDKKTRDAFLVMLKEFQEKIGKKLPISEDYTVHWMTLEAWVREQMSQGVELPKDVFGIYTQYISKIHHPKDKE